MEATQNAVPDFFVVDVVAGLHVVRAFFFVFEPDRNRRQLTVGRKEPKRDSQGEKTNYNDRSRVMRNLELLENKMLQF